MDLLQSLFKEALRQARRVPAVKKPPVNQYLIEENWSPGPSIELIHESSTGTLTLIGFFRESFFKKTSTRRLLPEATEEDPDYIEYVHGNHWLDIHSVVEGQDSEWEVNALYRRFWELLEEMEEGNE